MFIFNQVLEESGFCFLFAQKFHPVGTHARDKGRHPQSHPRQRLFSLTVHALRRACEEEDQRAHSVQRARPPNESIMPFLLPHGSFL